MRLAFFFVLIAAPAFAIGTDEALGASPAAAQARIDRGDHAGALTLLAPIVKTEPRNAGALNLAGYASRKNG